MDQITNKDDGDIGDSFGYIMTLTARLFIVIWNDRIIVGCELERNSKEVLLASFKYLNRQPLSNLLQPDFTFSVI
jgi:hypothetical protein